MRGTTTRGAIAFGLAFCVLCILCGTARAEEPPAAFRPADCECVEQDCTRRLFRNARWSWKNDPLLSLADGRFTFHVRLSAFLDAQWFADDEYVAEGGRAGPQADRFTVNRFRLGFDGKIGEHTTYRFTYELASQGDIRGFGQGASGVRDLYVDGSWLREHFGCAAPSVRVGAFVEPFGLENTRGRRNVTFMTRAATNVFRPGHCTGIMVSNDLARDRFGYRIGIFANSQVAWNYPSTVFGDVDTERDGFNVAGRLLWSPTGNERRFVAHLGVSYLHAWGMTAARFHARPENRAADHVIDTSYSTSPAGIPLLRDTSSVDLLGGEVMLLYERWMFQAEGFACAVQSGPGGDPVFGGAYVYVACMLTGEHYRRENGDLAHMEPCSAFDPLREGRWGGGAWEAAVRYTYVDLDSGNVRGGTMNNVTVGLNWHGNSSLRVQFNYVHSLVDDGVADASIGIFQARLEFDL